MAEPIVCKALVAFGVDDLREQEVIVSIVLQVYTAVYRSIMPSVQYALTMMVQFIAKIPLLRLRYNFAASNRSIHYTVYCSATRRVAAQYSIPAPLGRPRT